MISFKMFLSDYDDDRHIPSQSPVTRTLQEAMDEFENLSDSEGCFFGLIDESGNIVQFMWNADHSLTVDIPRPAQGGSLKKQASFDECLALLASFGNGIHVNRIPGLTFEAW
jgi:hypothetical protein